MKQEQIQLVQETLAVVAEMETSVVDKFYERLFERAPFLRPLFPENLTSQKQKFAAMLRFIGPALDDWRSTIVRIESLGRAHRGYGAKPNHYPLVTGALLDSIAEELGPELTPDRAAACQTMLETISRVMIDAAEYGTWSPGEDSRENPFTPIMGVSIGRYAQLVRALHVNGSVTISAEQLAVVGLDWQTWEVVSSGWNARLTDARYGAVVSAEYVAAYQQSSAPLNVG